MPHSEGTSRSDDYGGGTASIKGKGAPTQDLNVRPLTLQQQAWYDNYTREDRNPMKRLGNVAKSRQERMKRD
jgi:hypothetical protein